MAAVVVAIVVLADGCGWLFEPDQDTALIGDSITDQARSAFRAELGDDHDLDIRAVGGLRTDQLVGPTAEAAARHPDAAVVNLGTNDVFQDHPLDASMASMDELLGLLDGVPCSFVVTVNESMASGAGDDVAGRAAAFNDGLRQVAVAHGVEVIDWAAFVEAYLAAGQPEGDLTFDTIHPTEVGQRLLIQLYDDALAGCDPDVGG